VGVFENIERAQAAENETRSFVRQIAEFWDNLSEDEKGIWWKKVTEDQDLTPVEIELSKKYQIELGDWSTGLDWLAGGMIEEPERAVTRYKNLVFVQNITETWAGPLPFDRLLEKLGGKAFYSMESWTRLWWNFSCDFLDASNLGACKGVFEEAPMYDGNLYEHNIYVSETEIKVDGLHLIVDNLQLWGPQALEYLTELAASNGASNVQYKVRQED
jgi:hypothetical protein